MTLASLLITFSYPLDIQARVTSVHMTCTKRKTAPKGGKGLCTQKGDSETRGIEEHYSSTYKGMRHSACTTMAMQSHSSFTAGMSYGDLIDYR